MQAAKNFRMMVLLLGAAPLFAQSQQQTPPAQQTPAQSNQSAPAAPAAKKPSTADDNPFPEDISRKAAADDNAAPSAPSTPDSTKPPGSAPPADSSTPPRSTSPAGDNSSSRSKFEGLGDLPDDDNFSRISNGAGGYIVNPKLAAQDVKIGGFYLDQRDYKGAYARFKEAMLVDAGNADAVFGLAEAARGLNHKDEAVQNYQLYLDASPDGKKAKEARKALASMSESQAPKK